MQLPKRKHPRLKAYDYSESGVYFLTVCTKNKVHSLGEIVGRDALGAPCRHRTQLSPAGQCVERQILKTHTVYPTLTVLHYVIMPNHIHLLLEIRSSENGAPRASRPTREEFQLAIVPHSAQIIPRYVAALKRFSTKEAGQLLWQTGYYDHIIRNDADLQTHWTYTDENPAKWADDAYF